MKAPKSLVPKTPSIGKDHFGAAQDRFRTNFRIVPGKNSPPQEVNYSISSPNTTGGSISGGKPPKI